ncbi:sigma-70 family RNA polymerase sigma factor [Tannerella sp. 6_1_58FAA_CT1]|jgi:RNA polymerase sigma factor, sigma-70 family|nr:sigma-70 family RNA polymerase sigma factor [Tannerella sp. 6_1_58FAA_CT1]
MVGDTEQDIIMKLRDPKMRNAGFEQLVVMYRESLYWHIRRLVVSNEDAEDILQESLIKAYRSLDEFRGESRLFTWLYRIATNESLQFLRRKKLSFTPYEEVSDMLIQTLYAENNTDADELLLRFQEAILRLPEKQRVVFNLRYYDELSYEEISRITGQSVATLKTGYHYAVEKVKKYMVNSQI